MRNLNVYTGLIFVALLGIGCSVEEKEQDQINEGTQQSVFAQDDGQDLDLKNCKQPKQPKPPKPPKPPKKPKPSENQEIGESAACTQHKIDIANQGIFIHSSGLRVRFINIRLSFSDAQVACANSSTVATLKPATPDELALLDDLFFTEDNEPCKTDVWAEKVNSKGVVKGTRYLMPDVTELGKGTDAKVICVVQE
ncbi:MAG: hypothetical protein AB7T49_19175 [Oligoflexales bacterium]